MVKSWHMEDYTYHASQELPVPEGYHHYTDTKGEQGGDST